MLRLLAITAAAVSLALAPTAAAYPYDPPSGNCVWHYINQYNGWWECH